jgi:excisionase family DNA binding protein
MTTASNKVELYTRKEVAELFDCSLRTIYNWSKSGRLKAYGLGSRVFYKVDEVHASLTPKF